MQADDSGYSVSINAGFAGLATPIRWRHPSQGRNATRVGAEAWVQGIPRFWCRGGCARS